MSYNFDEVIDRRQSKSFKWTFYGADVIPLWVADMDFPCPDPIRQALHERVEHRIFGYQYDHQELAQTVCAHLSKNYNWKVSPDYLVFLPSVISALALTMQMLSKRGESILVQTPLYPPFLYMPKNLDRRVIECDLSIVGKSKLLNYEIDFDRLESMIEPNTRALMLCHPHNPIGRSFSPQELKTIHEMCVRRSIALVSDEAHCDLTIDDIPHVPFASVCEEMFENSITIMAASKTFNLPGLPCAYTIIKNSEQRKLFQAWVLSVTPKVDVLALTAAQVAYAKCMDWLTELRPYLRANRDFVVQFINENIPAIKITKPTATYLSWLDCRELRLEQNPFRFFLDKAKVALIDGYDYGHAGKGFVRLNFACPRSLLAEALQRMKDSVSA